MNLLIMGAPGTGKGTMSNIITKEFEVVHVSTGDMLRASIANGSPVGLEAQNYMNSGKLVPDSIIHDIIVERLGQKDMDAGFLMDGYPRTLEQAKDLSLILDEVGKKIDLVINLYVDDEVLKERITGRRLCKKCGAIYHTKNSPAKVEGICDVCGSALIRRADDVPEIIRNRLKVYHEETEQLINYYKEKELLEPIDINIYSETTREDTTTKTFKAIDNRIAE